MLCLSIGIGNKKKHQSHQSSLLYDDKTIQDHEKKVFRLFKAIRTAINRPYHQQDHRDDHHRQLLFDIYDAKNSSSIHHDHHHSYLNDSSIGSNENENSHNFTGTTTTTTTTVIVVTSSRFYNSNNYNYNSDRCIWRLNRIVAKAAHMMNFPVLEREELEHRLTYKAEYLPKNEEIVKIIKLSDHLPPPVSSIIATTMLSMIACLTQNNTSSVHGSSSIGSQGRK